MPERTVYLETFGCQMNELDSELVQGQLASLGYRFSRDASDADVVLYNTCSVREHAEQKVWSRLGELRARKAEQPNLVVGVLGCLAERDGEALIRRMPVVDILCGPGELDRLPVLLDNAVRTKSALAADDSGVEGRAKLVSARQVALQGNSSRRSATLSAAADSLELLDLSRSTSALAENKGTAYVRITRGCNKFCTYCVVPYTRGPEIHRPPDHIVDECRKLADAGVVEITLLGQTVNHYRFEHGAAVTIGGIVQPQKGRPFNGPERGGQRVTTFAGLLHRIHDEVPAIQRLRFVTSYPRDFGDDVLEVIRDHPRICRYLHVPAQTGSDRLLSLMNRGYSVNEYLEFLDRARSILHQPEIGRPVTFAGDIIVGFPTETEDDVDATELLLERARYKNCFIFKYSSRPGTVAHDKLADDVPEIVKRARNSRLLGVQQRISEQVSSEYLGRTVDVFVEGLSRKEAKRMAQVGASSANSGKQKHGSVQLTIGGLAPHDSDDACNSHCHSAAVRDPERASGAIQLSGRTDGDLIVLFDLPEGSSPDSMFGRIVPLEIIETRPLALLGRLV